MQRRKLFMNFVLLLSGNVLGQFLFFIGFVHLARVLGPQGFGVWNFALALLMYFHRAGEFGLEVIGVREIAREPSEISSWIAKIIVIRVILASILFTIGILLVIFHLIPQKYGTLFLIFLISIFPMAILLEWVYEGLQRLMQVSIARIAKGMLFLLFALIFVRTDMDIKQSSIIYVISLALPILFIFRIVWKEFGFGRFPLRSEILNTLRAASPIGIATLLSNYSLFLGTIVVGYLLTAEDLGYYAAGQRIVIFLWAYLINSLHRVLLPTLVKNYKQDIKAFSEFTISFFRRAVIGSFGFGLIISIIAPAIIVILYSSQYASSLKVFQYMIWAFVVAGIRCIFEISLIASDNQNRYLGGMIILAVLYTFLMPVLTLRYGITGAAIGSVISEMGYLIFLIATFPYLKFTLLLSHLWKPTIGLAAGILGVLIFSTVGWWLQLIISMSAYLLVLIFIKGISMEDCNWLVTLLHGAENEVTA